MNHTVVRVIDGDTFEVAPPWKKKMLTGSLVRVSGLTPPAEGEDGYEEAIQQLRDLIEGRTVDVRPVKHAYDRLVARVFLDGASVSELLRPASDDTVRIDMND